VEGRTIPAGAPALRRSGGGTGGGDTHVYIFIYIDICSIVISKELPTSLLGASQTREQRCKGHIHIYIYIYVYIYKLTYI